MRLELTLHRLCTCRAVQRIEVEVARPRPGMLALCYIVTGISADIVLPAPERGSQRGDELWKHTCFEAFVLTPPGSSYLEFNVAPSGAWASYRFDAYRKGMRIAEDASLAACSGRYGPDKIEIAPQFDLTGAAGHEQPWRVGLSAVIEQTDGAKSYWALKHPPGKPDFHHCDSFAYELNP